MTLPLIRRAAIGIGHLVRNLMPAHHSSWARAMLREIAEIDDDREALHFAAGCLRASATQALLFHLTRLLRGAQSSRLDEGGLMTMNIDRLIKNPRAVGIACAVGATGLGIAYMAAAGAPARYISMNAAALVIGLILLAAIGRTVEHVRTPPGTVPLLTGIALLATALFGSAADGATRWISVGSLALQPSLVLLPVLIMGFSRQRDIVGMIGVGIAACALAIQPDRAMAGVLAASMAMLLLLKPDRAVMGALAVAVLGFLVTLSRPETLPVSPYVDQILYSAFDVHVLAGLAVVAGAGLLIVPAAFLARGSHRETYALFGVIWLGIVAAAALGNYPTPLVGYGGSAILGYLLSLAALPKAAAFYPQANPRRREASQSNGAEEANMRIGLV